MGREIWSAGLFHGHNKGGMSQGRVVVASDHGGYALKEALKSQLIARGVDVLDVGTYSTDSVDYPVYARAAAETVE